MASATRRVFPCDTEAQTMTDFMGRSLLRVLAIRSIRRGDSTAGPDVTPGPEQGLFRPGRVVVGA
ncbi:predicted protein [Streptomyces sp. C]|nr:predicted protein [Streptomyces sp. C]